MDSARVHQCMVCTSKHPLSSVEKKKMIMNYTDENIDMLNELSKYSCLKLASPANHFMTTRLQYRTLKFLSSIFSIISKLLKAHTKTQPKINIPDLDGPLDCYQRSELFDLLCHKIIKNSYILGENFLKIDTDDLCWRQAFDQTIYLLHRINKSLWTYSLKYHPVRCHDCCNDV